MKNLRLLGFWLGLILAVSWVAMLYLQKPAPESRLSPKYIPVSNMVLIAHAGGGLPEGTYSNARQALDLSARNGFKLIEVDFSWTGRRELVLAHDWAERHYQYFSRLTNMPPAIARKFPKPAHSQARFLARKMNNGLTQMSLDDLVVWMDEHPSISVITDVKANNIDALTEIKRVAGPLQSRLIVQIYAPHEYGEARALGYDKIIFTSYRSAMNNQQLVDFTKNHKLYALSIPATRASTTFVQAITATKTPVFVHTLNTQAHADAMRKFGVLGIYTDYLYPAQ